MAFGINIPHVSFSISQHREPYRLVGSRSVPWLDGYRILHYPGDPRFFFVYDVGFIPPYSTAFVLPELFCCSELDSCLVPVSSSNVSILM